MLPRIEINQPEISRSLMHDQLKYMIDVYLYRKIRPHNLVFLLGWMAQK